MHWLRRRALARAALHVFLAAGCTGVPALAQAPDPLELVKEGRKLNAAGKPDEALALYERALAVDPDLFDAHLGAGIALDLMGDYAKARAHLQKAIERAPAGAAPQALSAMAVSHVFEGRTADAARYYRQLFDLQMSAGALDGAAATANALGRVYLEGGDLDAAQTWYTQGYETASLLKDLPPDQRDLWALRYRHALSRMAARRGNFHEAARLANEVKRIVDKGGPNEEQRPVYQYLVGYNAFHEGRDAAAIAELAGADQNDPFILGLLAQAWERRGDRAKALAYYERVLASTSHSLQNALVRELARKRVRELKP
jgi:tetratricopeptide (TPR) repeat protein